MAALGINLFQCNHESLTATRDNHESKSAHSTNGLMLQLAWNREESVKPDLNFIEDSFNLHMENLYMKHPQNMNYKKDLPIYIDQENPNRYFSLTCGVIHTWAQALVSTSLINRAANFFANSKFFELGCQ
ncbi:uncharacterized protein VP01_1693g2 [Puccinia sorghi]|uniref:Uncharacterized protein n=1 Tax=Puccinia sorghi TaxID=27349 RepID=A0A0L6VFW1_9BASI|nr:uncharacterized protein VP01_1693g2 [Puccinia sorghi]